MAKVHPVLNRLLQAPSRQLDMRLSRCVPMLDMIKLPPVDFLFTLGKAYRFNTRGINCIYFAEDEQTAKAEYDKHNVRGDQPITTFFAQVSLRAVLDLCDARSRRACGISVAQLRKPWVGAKGATATQLLGRAVSSQTAFSAIRYPSEAARKEGFEGACVVIFRDCVQPPDSVEIIGPGSTVLQKWP